MRIHMPNSRGLSWWICRIRFLTGTNSVCDSKIWILQTLTLTCSLAPDPEDIIWENLGVPEENRGIRDIFSNSLHIVFLAFYAIPLALFTSLFNLSRLSGLSPAIARFLTNHPDLASFVSGTLASLGITLIIAILPYGVQCKPICVNIVSNVISR